MQDTETKPRPVVPGTLRDIHAYYREIAPEPEPDHPDVARELTRSLLVSAIRRDVRNTAAILGAGKAISADDVHALVAEFAAAHALQEMQNNTPAVADEAAAVIAGATLSGEAGEWVREHARALGIDVTEVYALAIAETDLRAAQTAAEAKAQADAKMEIENAAREMSAALRLAQDAMEAIHKVADSHSRVMYAAMIEISRGNPNGAWAMLDEQLDGEFRDDAAEVWDGTETGMQWLNRMRAMRQAGAKPGGDRT